MSELKLEETEAQKLLMRKARAGGMLAFTILTKPDYQVNWHHKVLCNTLNKFIRGEIKRLMVFMPPRMGKSELVSRRLPALIHGLDNNAEIMMATYNSELASDMTIDIQRIMDRPIYKELFPHSQITAEGKLSKYARNATEHELIPFVENGVTHYPLGSFRAQGVGGSFTGRGATTILIDDPFRNRADADSKNYRDTLYKFYTSTLYSRLEKDGKILICQTRWHSDDLAARLLTVAKVDSDADQWTILSLPAIRDDLENPWDPRALGDPLWPDKYSKETMVKMQATMGSRDWSALYQQKPTAEEGNIFKATWFKTYAVIPDKFDQVIQSWDFAVKDKTGSDYNVCTVWGRKGTNKYLLDMVRGRWPFPMACQKVIDVSKRWPQSYKKLIEDKANGPAIKQTLDKYVTGIVAIEPRGDKVARANAVAPEVESGNVWIPSPQIAPWINDFINEMCEFPHGVHDDIVDSSTMALDELRKAHVAYLPIAGHSGVTW